VRNTFSPLLEMDVLARALGLPLRALRHVLIFQNPTSLAPDAMPGASKTFTVPDNQCAVLAHFDLKIYPQDAGGTTDYTREIGPEEADAVFELTFTRTGTDDVNDERGARRISGPQLLVLPPGEYVLSFADGQGTGALGYTVAYRVDAYLLPEEKAEELRQIETRVL